MADYLSFVTVTLTHAQILTLPTTGVEIVAAPGEDKIALPLQVAAFSDTLAGAYTIDTTKSGLSLSTPSLDYASGFALLHQVLNVAQQRHVMLPVPYLKAALTGDYAPHVLNGAWLSTPDMVNAPLLLVDNWSGHADYTGGNAANTLTIAVLYMVYNVATKAYVSASAAPVPAGVPHAVYAAGGSVRFR